MYLGPGCLAGNFRFNLIGDGQILKGWGQGAGTPSRHPVVGKEKIPPSSYLSVSGMYQKEMVTPDKMKFYPGTLLLCAMSRIPRCSQHGRSEMQGDHVQTQVGQLSQWWDGNGAPCPNHSTGLLPRATYQVSLHSSWGFLYIPPPPQMPFFLLHRMVTLFNRDPARKGSTA